MTEPQLKAPELVGDGFKLLFANFSVLYALAMVFALVEQVIYIIVGDGFSMPGPDQTFDGGAFLSSMLLITVIWNYASGVLCLATVDCLNERRRPLAEYLTRPIPKIGPMVVLGLLVAIATGLGAFLFIVPGFYIYAMYLVLVPVIVLEDGDWRSLTRTRDLTHGHRWTIVLALVILVVMLIGASMVVSPVITPNATGEFSLMGNVLAALVQGMTFAVFSIFTTLVYVRLVGLRDRVKPSELYPLN
ncbi:hypothetical protein [Amaricoccus tamworthensis]|uniref:hypothetical protein n=1 Tax=Amaricoccus tamworthensis TaxID=57002 RepID=UPI003C7AA173